MPHPAAKFVFPIPVMGIGDMLLSYFIRESSF